MLMPTSPPSFLLTSIVPKKSLPGVSIREPSLASGSVAAVADLSLVSSSKGKEIQGTMVKSLNYLTAPSKEQRKARQIFINEVLAVKKATELIGDAHEHFSAKGTKNLDYASIFDLTKVLGRLINSNVRTLVRDKTLISHQEKLTKQTDQMKSLEAELAELRKFKAEHDLELNRAQALAESAREELEKTQSLANERGTLLKSAQGELGRMTAELTKAEKALEESSSKFVAA